MKKLLNVAKKHWITVWLCAALLFFGAFVTYAAYTEVSSVKRVVSTQSSPGEMFSSNCLRADISSRRLTSPQYTITVCNYDQDKPTVYNPSTITYTLHAEIQVQINNNYYTMSQLRTALNDDTEYNTYVSKIANYCIYKTYDDLNPSTALTVSKQYFTSGNNYTVNFSTDTLRQTTSSVDRYKVEIEPNSVNDNNTNIFVHVWAEPTDPSNLRTIESRLYGAAASADTSTWTGALHETDCDTVDYDFYNYIITGSGTGTVDILWDPNKFEPNPFFFVDSGNVFANGNSTPTTIAAGDPNYDSSYAGWKKVTLVVNSTVKNRYELQLYKTAQSSPTGVSYTGANSADSFIDCIFTES